MKTKLGDDDCRGTHQPQPERFITPPFLCPMEQRANRQHQKQGCKWKQILYTKQKAQTDRGK